MADELTLVGELVFKSSPGGSTRLRIAGRGGNIWAGGNGADGDLILFPSNGDNDTVAQASLHLDGNGGNIWAGGNGRDGDVLLLPDTATDIHDSASARIRLDAGGGNVWLGGNGRDGDLVLFRSGDDNRTLSLASIHLDGNQSNLWMGGNGTDGDIVLFPSQATNLNDLSQATIHLDGNAGDIKLLNADAAEEFDVVDGDHAEAGDVLVVDDDEHLRRSTSAYDSRVAGVVSGAGAYRPGIVLGHDGSHPDRVPVALMGRVHCKVDATEQPIAVGDMLTTAERPGHAMRATDRTAAFGAVLGKALGRLDRGTGLVPVLVALQ